MSRIITIVIIIILLQGILIFFVFTDKQSKSEQQSAELSSLHETRKKLFELEPLDLGEIVVPLPALKEDEEVTAKVKVVVYLKESKDIKVEEFRKKYRPKLREIAAKIIKGTSYTKLRNRIEEEEAIKVVMKNVMNRTIGKEIVEEVVFDGAIVFE
ncbi:MAG: hypothetical protein ACK4NF_05645 [Planctomycetota bacterium]